MIKFGDCFIIMKSCISTGNRNLDELLDGGWHIGKTYFIIGYNRILFLKKIFNISIEHKNNNIISLCLLNDKLTYNYFDKTVRDAKKIIYGQDCKAIIICPAMGKNHDVQRSLDIIPDVLITAEGNHFKVRYGSSKNWSLLKSY